MHEGSPPIRLTVATHNPAKVREIARLVDGFADATPLPKSVRSFSIPEDGDTVEENAVAKAQGWSAVVGPEALVVATDGGLMIPALGDRWQPVRTRRFAGDGATDHERAERVLNLARGLHGDDRRIFWREALAVATDGHLLGSWAAESGPGALATTVDAELIAAGHGFWIPAIWRCPEFDGRLLAELSLDERRARPDHWEELGRQLRQFLTDYRRNR